MAARNSYRRLAKAKASASLKNWRQQKSGGVSRRRNIAYRAGRKYRISAGGISGDNIIARSPAAASAAENVCGRHVYHMAIDGALAAAVALSHQALRCENTGAISEQRVSLGVSAQRKSALRRKRGGKRHGNISRRNIGMMRCPASGSRLRDIRKAASKEENSVISKESASA